MKVSNLVLAFAFAAPWAIGAPTWINQQRDSLVRMNRTVSDKVSRSTVGGKLQYLHAFQRSPVNSTTVELPHISRQKRDLPVKSSPEHDDKTQSSRRAHLLEPQIREPPRELPIEGPIESKKFVQAFTNLTSPPGEINQRDPISPDPKLPANGGHVEPRNLNNWPLNGTTRPGSEKPCPSAGKGHDRRATDRVFRFVPHAMGHN